MANTQVALQMYTLRNFLKTPEDIAVTMKKVSKIGYKAVQLSGLGPIDAKELKNILDGEGLYACSSHYGIDAFEKEYDKTVEDHKLWGTKLTAVPMMPVTLWNEEGFKSFAPRLNVIGEKLHKDGIILGYHNHNFELERFNGKTGLQILFELTNPKYVTAEIDTYWITAGGGDPAAWIRKFPNRSPQVHLKDMTMRIKDKARSQVMAEIGEGNLNWPEILNACKTVGVEWYIIEQDACERDPFESVAISLKNVNAMGLK
ncbi:MAG: sugar phosphate isomerase/epimerase [Elusimicrobiota bacterium]